jgi:hypothetical protein
LDRYGGWRATVRAELSSITCEFKCRPTETALSGGDILRAQYTILQMADGMRIHTAVSSLSPDSAKLHSPKMTFIDEIMAE